MACISSTSTHYKNNRIHNFPDYEEIQINSILDISSSLSSEMQTCILDLEEMHHLIYDVKKGNVTLQL